MKQTKLLTVRMGLSALLMCFSGLAIARTGTAPTKEAKEELAGSWTSPCHKADLVRYLIDDEYTRETFDFEKQGTFKRGIFRYADPQCRDLVVTETLTGHYDLGFPVVLNGKFGVRELNVKVEKAFAGPHDQAAADRLNRASYCGLNSWRPTQTVDVTGRTCEGDRAEAGLDIADVVKVTGRRLFLGQASFFRTGRNGGLRPNALDEERPYSLNMGQSH